MKQARLVWTVLAALALATWATAFACDQQAKGAKAASASKAACTPEMAAKCTAAQAAACRVKGASAAAADARGLCPHGAGVGASAVTADYAAGCAAHGAKAATAIAAPGRGAKAVLAGGPGCGAHEAKAAVAGTGSCAAHGPKAKSAGVAGCAGHEVSTAAAHNYADCEHCESCADMANCEKELESAGAVTQVVRLKNGVMYVYTADTPAHVRVVQAALARRGDKVARMAAAGDKTELCPPCRELRGATASGKLYRETVNIEGGCLTLMTSNDPAVVQRIYAMAGISSNGARAKS